jgi:hypothetical protein
MKTISLATAISLTGRSKRTLWRLVADGAITRAADNAGGSAMVDLASLKPYFQMQIAPEDFELIERADAGGGGVALRHKTSWPCFFWKTASRKALFTGWSWPPNKVARTPCTGWGAAI